MKREQTAYNETVLDKGKHRKVENDMKVNNGQYLQCIFFTLSYRFLAEPQLQIFRPTLLPLNTGKPACQVSSHPLPSLLKFSQNTAFPLSGLKTTPILPSFPSSFPPTSSPPHSKNSHHLPFLILNLGNSDPPPSQSASTYTIKVLTRSMSRLAPLQS